MKDVARVIVRSKLIDGQQDTFVNFCPQGTYSDTESASSCTPCPQGRITANEGSTSSSQCLAGKKLNIYLSGKKCLTVFSC